MSKKTPRDALEKAIQALGGFVAACDKLCVAQSTLGSWRARGVPVRKVLVIERLTGVSRHDLRPDIYPNH
jgi:DNA-binding transcriptional regulator YdaS (Cro superfamily)